MAQRRSDGRVAALVALHRGHAARDETHTIVVAADEVECLRFIDDGDEDIAGTICVALPGRGMPASWAILFRGREVVLMFDESLRKYRGIRKQLDATIGLAAITTRPMAVSQHIIAWISNQRFVIPEFLLLVFYGMASDLERFTFGATLKTIGMPDVNKLSAAIPPLPEQRLIIDLVFRKLGKIDNAVAKAERAIALLKERRSALISAAVTGKIDVREA